MEIAQTDVLCKGPGCGVPDVSVGHAKRAVWLVSKVAIPDIQMVEGIVTHTAIGGASQATNGICSTVLV